MSCFLQKLKCFKVAVSITLACPASHDVALILLLSAFSCSIEKCQKRLEKFKQNPRVTKVSTVTVVKSTASRRMTVSWDSTSGSLQGFRLVRGVPLQKPRRFSSPPPSQLLLFPVLPSLPAAHRCDDTVPDRRDLMTGRPERGIKVVVRSSGLH